MDREIELSKDKQVVRRGDRVLRPARPWSANTMGFLAHLGHAGFPAPRAYGIIDGMECVEYLPGEFVHPCKWSDEGLHEIGRMTARLHRASQGFAPDEAAGYAPWCLREIGDGEPLWSHGDIAPWNTIAVGGLPTRLIDWEFAGPIAPLVELARVCWLFVQLVDDDLAELYGLPSPEGRARQVGVVLDGYGLARDRRAGMAERILEVAICETAHEAIDPGVRPPDVGSLWGFAWRTRSVYWVWRHRRLLEATLIQGGAG